jgi:uncharacterized protein YukE
VNWSSLRKEQKQAAVLIGMWLIGGLFALYHYVLAPFIKNRGASTNELAELKSQIQKADAARQGEAKLRAEYAESTEKMNSAMERYIVPMENPLSWATEKVYTTARGVGVDLQSVSEVGAGEGEWAGLLKAGRTFRPYAVRIATECGYAQIVDFLKALQESDPYLCVVGIFVAALDASPTRHTVSVTVEWPMWGKRVDVGQALKEEPGKVVEPGSPPAK